MPDTDTCLKRNRAELDSETPKVVVLGSGSFGTALGTVIARNGFKVTLWTRREEVARLINSEHRNPTHLNDFLLPNNVEATTDLRSALSDAAWVVHCVPVQQSESFLSDLVAPLLSPQTPIICTSKGIHTSTLETMQELIPRALGRAQPMAFLSGPTFAQELMKEFPSGAVLACTDADLANQAANLFRSGTFRIYVSSDVVGVLVGGALKNVFALMAGAVEGMGLGANTAAMLVTLACREMSQVAHALGGLPATLSGLAGMGDLMLTCNGGASRNRTVGVRLGKGETINDILTDRAKGLAGVAEGVATAPAAVKLADKHKLRAPMLRACCAVVEGKLTSNEAVELLLSYPANSDLVIGDTLK